MKMIDAAAAYALRGLAVFPCAKKIPLTGSGGFKNATCDAVKIAEWWTANPNAQIALPTGEVNGLFVVDVDGPEGERAAVALNLPETFAVATRPGRYQFWFRQPGGARSKCTAGVLGPQLDTRGDGGYVIAPPSIHHETGQPYRVLKDIAWAPARIELLSPRGAPVLHSPNSDAIPQGRRHNTLLGIAGALRARGLSREIVLAELESANSRLCIPPLDFAEIEKIADYVGSKPAGSAGKRPIAQPEWKSEPPGWIEIFDSFAEFEQTQPLSFSIDGFLQNEAATGIAGLSGHGKTWIALSIAKSLLSSEPLWGLFPVRERADRLVYLIPEASRSSFKHRLRLMGLYPHIESQRLLVRTLSKGPAPDLCDARILYAAKGAHVVLDTAIRFGDGDENSAGDNQRGLATDIFNLLGAGARSVTALHHSAKAFGRETTMTLENALRGTGDLGAMLATAWAVKQLDRDQNLIHVENVKPRDFQPCGPFQIIGRPHIDDRGDFALYKKPGECGALADEQEPQRDKGGAPIQAREARAAKIELMRQWRGKHGEETSEEISARFKEIGMDVSPVTVRKYRGKIER